MTDLMWSSLFRHPELDVDELTLSASRLTLVPLLLLNLVAKLS